MVTPGVPGEGTHARLFMIALATFSSQCESPELTPACPFYRMTPSGPQCGEECVDILADHGGVATHRGPFMVIDEYEVRRRVPTVQRRAPAERSSPFDARQIELIDRDKPTADRRTVALIRDLRESLVTPPSISDDREDRRYRILANWEELDKRGVPVDLLVREGLALSIAFAGLQLVAFDATPDADQTAGWKALMDLVAKEKTDENGNREIYLNGERFSRIASVLAGATRDDLADMKAPTTAQVLATPPRGVTRETLLANWLHDRFGQTFVENWTPASRAFEWEYIHGREPGCCPPSVMHERYVSPDDLRDSLADKGSESLLDVEQQDARSRGLRTGDFARIAADHLAEGNFQAAADLFRALVQLGPQDATALNNLGFCLMPSDVAVALDQLMMAEALYSKFDATNAANIVLALHLLGRDEEALARAADAIPMFSRADTPAWLWRHSAGEPLVLDPETIEPAEYINSVIEHIRTNPAGCQR
jgi:hypothetical protein